MENMLIRVVKKSSTNHYFKRGPNVRMMMKINLQLRNQVARKLKKLKRKKRKKFFKKIIMKRILENFILKIIWSRKLIMIVWN